MRWSENVEWHNSATFYICRHIKAFNEYTAPTFYENLMNRNNNFKWFIDACANRMHTHSDKRNVLFVCIRKLSDIELMWTTIHRKHCEIFIIFVCFFFFSMKTQKALYHTTTNRHSDCITNENTPLHIHHNRTKMEKFNDRNTIT